MLPVPINKKYIKNKYRDSVNTKIREKEINKAGIGTDKFSKNTTRDTLQSINPLTTGFGTGEFSK
jgi:hypothetical protein